MFTLPELPYEYDALEPYIDKETMHLHHDKHHATYVEKLNEALKDQTNLLSMPVEELLANLDLVPESSKQAVINHGGGHANHSFFWEIMTAPGKKGTYTVGPSEQFTEAIDKYFTNIEILKKEFTGKAMSVFGSGWAFLVMTPNGELKLKRHSFQNSPLMTGNTPILGVDVWEHAYYLKYQNKRADYIDAWWNVINWNKVSQNFAKALKKV